MIILLQEYRLIGFIFDFIRFDFMSSTSRAMMYCLSSAIIEGIVMGFQ